jgi:alpha-methylacyl-CoA racemase
MAGPLAGIRIIELAGIGPGPFCGMMLADMGAEVIRVDRPGGNPMAELGHEVMFRSRRAIAVDLKNPRGAETILRLCEKADAIFEGFRPGVAERLGVGPDACLKRNPRIVYGRMTGWGQDGPLAQAAGHDINYISLSGALHAIGRKGDAPLPPLNLVGDFGGGAMMLAFGMVCALLEAQKSGKGQVIDSSMVEGSAALMAMYFGFRSAGVFTDQRGTHLLDTGAPFYEVYETADGKFVSIGSLEPQFYALLVEKLQLDKAIFGAQMKVSSWPQMREALRAKFREKTRDEWCALLEGSDVCFGPVLALSEVHQHAHNQARQSFVKIGGITQPAPTPRFSRTPSGAPTPRTKPGVDTRAVLADVGFSDAEIENLQASGAVTCL